MSQWLTQKCFSHVLQNIPTVVLPKLIPVHSIFEPKRLEICTFSSCEDSSLLGSKPGNIQNKPGLKLVRENTEQLLKTLNYLFVLYQYVFYRLSPKVPQPRDN